MWVISAVSLAIVMAGCLTGIFAPKHVYNDNLAQRIGMAGVFCFCWPRLAQIIDQQTLSAQVVPAAAQLAGHIGMACFVLGTAFKAWRHRPRKPPSSLPPAPTALTSHWPHVSGGKQ